MKDLLWRTKREFGVAQAAWCSTPVTAVAINAMDSSVNGYSKVCHSLERGLEPCSIVAKLREEVTLWKAAVAVVRAVASPHMKERHWVRVQECVHSQLSRDDTFTVENLFQLNIVGQKDRCGC